MKLIKAKDYADLSRKTANILSAQVILNPKSVLGLATGASPIGTYKQLIDWYNRDDIDFSQVTKLLTSVERQKPAEQRWKYRHSVLCKKTFQTDHKQHVWTHSVHMPVCTFESIYHLLQVFYFKLQLFQPHYL